MALEIANTAQIKPNFGEAQIQTGADDARKLLHDLTVKVQDKSGSIKLMHTTDGSQNMAFERKSWWQFGTRKDTKMANTAKYVETLFREAYQPLVDSMPEGPDKDAKQKQLDDLIQGFQDHVAGKSNLFGKTTMREFFNRAEKEFVGEGQCSNIKAKGTQEAFKPNALDEANVVPLQNEGHPNNQSFGPALLIPDQNQEPNIGQGVIPNEDHNPFQPIFKNNVENEQVEPKQINAQTFGPEQLIQEPNQEPNIVQNPIPLIAEPLIQEQPLQNNLNQPILINPQIRQIPEFKPSVAKTKNGLINKHLQGANREKIGSGSYGDVFKVERPGKPTTCLKLAKRIDSISIIPRDKNPASVNLRNFDASVIYMNSEKGLKIPHVARPTALIVKTQTNEVPAFHWVPLENYKEAKKYLRQLASSNTHAAIVGSEMPMAPGEEVDPFDLEGSGNAEHRQAIGKQLMEYVSESHKMGIIDRDHKPENLIYDKGQKKLTKIDLGMQTKLSTNPNKNISSHFFCGTPLYSSTFKSGEYGPNADLFEAGMSLMNVKYGSPFLTMAFSRFEASNMEGDLINNLRQTRGNESKTFIEYRNDPANAHKSYLQCLVEYSRTDTDEDKQIAAQILNDLKKGDPETKFYEQIFETSTKSIMVNDTTQGRKTVFADYYQKLDNLMQNQWIQ